MKVPVIELLEYNFLISLLDYFKTSLDNVKIHNKNINIIQSYSDKHNNYILPALSAEVLYRKNRSIGFGNLLAEEDNSFESIEIEGTLMEYRVQLNVYSNTRGENYKWCSIIDDVLKNGEQGIPLNTYNDNGSIKQQSIGIIDYDCSKDVKLNNLIPNVVSYDFHTIYEIKMNVVQTYKISYDIMEFGDIIGEKINKNKLEGDIDI